ncbi:putative zinc-binding dehydrogenase [Rosellinia necatrix]|uniref:Putative zinc-binding dehydrogenase n=1 Tax=Rosellinia necatrix TaxID=77044 RepID=A0A1S8A7U8_ROSNE|nr:putative zinc-binding dehydrogenase [Rosellinia necatrix]
MQLLRHNFDFVSRGRLKYALDCISICYAVIQRLGGEGVCGTSLENIFQESLGVWQAVRPAIVLAAEAFQEEIKLGHDGYSRPINKAKYELAVQYTKVVQRLLDQGRPTAHPVEMPEGRW